MNALDVPQGSRRPPRMVRLLVITAPREARPSENGRALSELLSRLGLRTALVDAGGAADRERVAGLAALAARGADYVIVVGDAPDGEVVETLRAALAPATVHVHALDLDREDAEVDRLARAGVWALGRLVVDGALLEAA